MTTPLDTLVARAVHQARTLERAVHESGPWTMTIGKQVSPARRELLDDRVVFTAEFEPISGTSLMVSLDLRGRMEAVRPLADTRVDAPFAIVWTIEATTAVPSIG